jgi:flagellin
MNLSHHSLSLASGLGRIDPRLESVSARVSSGRRLDSPAADPAGVGHAAKIESGQTRLRAAEVNIQNGVSRLQSTNGQLTALGRVVSRLSEISTLSVDAVQGDADRALYASEFARLQEQLRQVVGGSTAEIGGTAGVDHPLGMFNERPLFGPGPGDTLVIGSDAEERLTLPVLNFRSGALGDLVRQDASGRYTLTLGSAGSATLNSGLRAALDQIADAQAEVGAGQSRLALATGFVTTASANHEAALGEIQDADIAAETTKLARLQIVAEGHTAMLGQARDMTAKLLPLLARKG